MTTTSDRPITVDGVRLDTLAWNITKVNRATAGRRGGDVTLPGLDGSLPTLNDNLEPVTFGLDMFVMGTDVDGAVPAAGRRDTFRKNLDELVHLFGKRHALLEVIEQVNATESRRAWAKVDGALTPDINVPGSVGQFTVGLVLPYAVWEDTATSDWGTGGATPPNVATEVTTLQGATERITDATLVLVNGDAATLTNPRITDPSTGAYVQYNGSLAQNQTWRINCATWATRTFIWPGSYAAALDKADTFGTDVTPQTTYGGTVNQAAFLPLVPVRDTGLRRVKVTLTGGGGAANVFLGIRARRKYAL